MGKTAPQVSVKISAHVQSHPGEILLQTANGHAYLTQREARRLARELDALADHARSDLLAELMADRGVVV